LEVVEKLIEEFQWQDKKIIHVFNKVDAALPDAQFRVKQYPRVFVSALTGQGIEQLKRLMVDLVQEMQSDVQLYFPRQDEHKIFDLSRETKIIRRESATEGTICYAQLSPALLVRWKEFLVK
jgi:GTP-binding protein HflX